MEVHHHPHVEKKVLLFVSPIAGINKNLTMHNIKKIFFAGTLMAMSFNIHAQKKYSVFNHVAIEVKNLDVSIAFYKAIFHLDSIPTPWPTRRIRWFKIGRNEQLHIIEADLGEHIIAAENFHFCFSVRSMDEFISRLKKLKIGYDNGDGKISSVNIRPDGVKQIYIKDPDGYLVEINDQAY